MSNAIEVRDLVKRYNGSPHPAVDAVSFAIQEGEIFSLLGPNGAGKTTTISMLSCLLQPTAGDALVAGRSVVRDQQAVKRAIGVVPQEVALYPDLSARENLIFWGKMYGLRGTALDQRVDEILETIGLADRQKERVDRYSGGMKRRLNIGAALLHRPRIVYMDEPTVGIDPQSRRNILDAVKELNRRGMTVLYTTHYMEEAQELSHHVGVMDGGKIIALGTQQELVRLVGEKDRIELTTTGDPAEVVRLWQAVPGVAGVSVDDGRFSVLADDSNLVLPRLFETAAQSGRRVTSVAVEEPNLETVFLHLTGRALRD